MTRKTSHPASVPVREPIQEKQLGLERLIFFSDAVFAIAITLLILEIRLPESAGESSDSALLQQLFGIWHKYLAYLITFFVIGSFWTAHHRKFRYIIGYDTKLLFLNLLMLMVVAFMPFPSSIIAEYSNRTATIFYAATMILASLFALAIWSYASHNNRLINAQMNQTQRRREFAKPVATAAVFLLSIGIAFINPDLARLTWALILPISLFTSKA
jgi:uncharacterized membrane protein